MGDILTFQRVETKYRLSADEYERLWARLEPLLAPDAYPVSTVCSQYLDTSDFRIIRASMDGGKYREKLRLRCYETPNEGTRVFLELKKKFKGVVYKRREGLSYAEAKAYLAGGELPRDTQIMRELDYAMRFYDWPRPALILAYDRRAYLLRDNPRVRVTFDTNLRYRAEDLSLSLGMHGAPILPQDEHIMEIKTDGGMPLFLSHLLNELCIYPTRFSKYKTAYLDLMQKQRQNQGEIACV